MKKRSLIYSILLILIATTVMAANFVIHDFTTGVMHSGTNISYTPTVHITSTNVEDAINVVNTTLETNLVAKSGSITQITTRNHDDLQTITGNGTVHLSATEKTQHDTAYTHSQNTTSAHGLTMANVADKTGSVGQFTNHSHTALTDIGTNTHAQVDTHIANTTSAHGLTIADVPSKTTVDTNLSTLSVELASHEVATTAIHGIVDAADLAVKSGSIAQFTTRSFKNLSDTPTDYTGKGGFYLRLNTAENALILDTPGIAPDEVVKADSADPTSGYLQDKVQNSLTIDIFNHKMELVGDTADISIGNWKSYGTNGSGTRGFYTLDHVNLSNIGTNTHSQIDSHISDTTTAHGIDGVLTNLSTLSVELTSHEVGVAAVHGIVSTSDLALKSGSLSQFTTRSAADLSSGTLPDARLSSNVPLINGTNTFSGSNTFNNTIAGNINGNSNTSTNATNHISNATGAHAATAVSSAPAGNLAAANVQAAVNELDTEKAGLALNNAFTGNNTFTGTVQLSDGTNTQTIVPPFRTDKSKCNLLVDFDNTLIDKTRGITPTGYSTATLWSNGWTNDTIAVGTVTSLGGSFRAFEGDRGKFGSGITVEESRTNRWNRSLLQYVSATTLVVSTNSTYRTNNYTSAYADSYAEFTSDTTDLKDPTGGYNACKMKYLSGGGNNYFYTTSAVTNGVTYTFSAWVCGSGTYKMGYTSNDSGTLTATSNWQRVTWTAAAAGTEARFYVVSGTIYVYGIQVEAGSYATSFILTTNGAVTRPAGQIRYSPVIDINNFSLSFWCESTMAISISTPGVYGNSIFLEVSSGKLLLSHDNSSTVWVTTSGSASLSTTNHIMITKSGTALKVYLNGVLDISITAGVQVNAGQILGIGYNAAGAAAFGTKQNIENLSLFNYALTLAEIKQIYYSDKPIMCEGAVKKEDITRTFAGDPNNDFAPMYLNEMVWDSTNSKWYKSKGVLSNAAFDTGAWILLN